MSLFEVVRIEELEKANAELRKSKAELVDENLRLREELNALREVTRGCADMAATLRSRLNSALSTRKLRAPTPESSGQPQGT